AELLPRVGRILRELLLEDQLHALVAVDDQHLLYGARLEQGDAVRGVDAGDARLEQSLDKPSNEHCEQHYKDDPAQRKGILHGETTLREGCCTAATVSLRAWGAARHVVEVPSPRGLGSSLAPAALVSPGLGS